MFKDLKKGSVVYVLDSSEKPKYYKAIIVSVSEPYFPQIQPGQPYPQQRLVNVVANVNGNNENYEGLPENFEITSKNNVALACSPDILSRQVETMLQNSREIIDSVERHREITASCEEILKNLSPAYAKTKAQDEKIDSLTKELSELKTRIPTLEDIQKLFIQSQQPQGKTLKNEK